MPVDVMGTISGYVSNLQTVSGTVTVPVSETIPTYDGDYTISPSTDGPVVLATSGKKLDDDITVSQVQETISATDDGEGNITLTGNITVIDDGGGNITL